MKKENLKKTEKREIEQRIQSLMASDSKAQGRIRNDIHGMLIVATHSLIDHQKPSDVFWWENCVRTFQHFPESATYVKKLADYGWQYSVASPFREVVGMLRYECACAGMEKALVNKDAILFGESHAVFAEHCDVHDMDDLKLWEKNITQAAQIFLPERVNKWAEAARQKIANSVQEPSVNQSSKPYALFYDKLVHLQYGLVDRMIAQAGPNQDKPLYQSGYRQFMEMFNPQDPCWCKKWQVHIGVAFEHFGDAFGRELVMNAPQPRVGGNTLFERLVGIARYNLQCRRPPAVRAQGTKNTAECE